MLAPAPEALSVAMTAYLSPASAAQRRLLATARRRGAPAPLNSGVSRHRTCPQPWVQLNGRLPAPVATASASGAPCACCRGRCRRHGRCRPAPPAGSLFRPPSRAAPLKSAAVSTAAAAPGGGSDDGVLRWTLEEVDVPSVRDPTEVYRVSVSRQEDGSAVALACSCPNYKFVRKKKGEHCKHMVQVEAEAEDTVLLAAAEAPAEDEAAAGWAARLVVKQAQQQQQQQQVAAVAAAVTDGALTLEEQSTATPQETAPVDAAAAVSDQLLAVLRETFGLASFQGGQRAVIEDLLSGRDCLVLMPTGYGKSLCYQLPAVILADHARYAAGRWWGTPGAAGQPGKGGVTLVVSPLISLMKDQVDSMTRLGINAVLVRPALALHPNFQPSPPDLLPGPSCLPAFCHPSFSSALAAPIKIQCCGWGAPTTGELSAARQRTGCRDPASPFRCGHPRLRGPRASSHGLQIGRPRCGYPAHGCTG
eukprot:SAG22_NODE_157_length_16986_cov_17.230177_2_plen_477_part_00